jgi:hypothetical protein
MANAIQDPMDRLSTIIEGEKSPFVELAERMKETSKDVKNLNMSILDLAIALEKRAGVKTDKQNTKEKKEKEPQFRNLGVDLKADFKDFAKGFISTFTTNSFAEKVIGKSQLPANVEKPDTVDTISDAEKIKPLDNIDKQEETKDIVTLEPVQSKDIDKPDLLQNKDTPEPDQTKILPDSAQNKVLSDMVEVLIDLRDDKSQKQLLSEAIAIKKLITDQSKKIELPGGIEPNNEEAKQEDREKLAEAIAIRLSDVIGGIGNNSGLGIPDLDKDKDKNKKGKSGGKTSNKSGRAKVSGFRIPPGAGKAAMIGGSILGGAGLALGAYEASEFLDETDYGSKMAEGAGQDAEKAFKNINPDFSKLDITQQQAQDILNQPDSPGKKRDLEAFGGEDELRKKAGLPKLEKPLDTTIEPSKKFEQASLRKYDYVPETSPKIPEVQPKTIDTTVGNVLNKVLEENTELKQYSMGKSETQMIAPIISKQTINNTEQTMITNPPSPNSISNSMIRWQDKRSSYTN